MWGWWVDVRLVGEWERSVCLCVVFFMTFHIYSHNYDTPAGKINGQLLELVGRDVCEGNQGGSLVQRGPSHWLERLSG